MKRIFYILIICINYQSIAQGDAVTSTKYPTDYFRNPLEIPMLLSGTFGELRSNHFHSGLDIKTELREGLKVFTAAPGYVSRIKISHWGFGKAIYITHPNGYTTVYAHLKKFSDRIESYIRKRQYKKESFEIQVFLGPETLPVSSNEMIAFSGSTGGFVGPHLHFEIRDTKSEKPINPLYFGLTVRDLKAPQINTIIGYPIDNESHINQNSVPTKLVLTQLNNGNFRARSIKAHGSISFGINTYDQMDGAANKNGLHSLELSMDGELMHHFEAGTFSFAETKYINLLIDYERYALLSQRIQKCFVEPQNILSMYQKKGTGYLNIKDGQNYEVVITAKDYAGNVRTVTIPVEGKKDAILAHKKVISTPYRIAHNQFNKFKIANVTVAFPSNTFYSDFDMNFKVENDSIVTVHEPVIPLNRSYTLTFDVTKYSQDERKRMYIASISDKGTTQYVSTTKKENTFYTSTKILGQFTLASDDKKPSVKLKNFKDEQWVTHFNELVVQIKDQESGIKSYRGEIDGKWILMEYNVKKGILTYDLNDRSFSEAKHKLTVEVTDNAGNTNLLSATFYRKK